MNKIVFLALLVFMITANVFSQTMSDEVNYDPSEPFIITIFSFVDYSDETGIMNVLSRPSDDVFKNYFMCKTLKNTYEMNSFNYTDKDRALVMFKFDDLKSCETVQNCAKILNGTNGDIILEISRETLRIFKVTLPKVCTLSKSW